MEAKNKDKKKRKPYKKKGGCLKTLVLTVLLLLITYLGLHIYFIWQPAGGVSDFNQKVMSLSVARQKVFPAVQAFDTTKIDGRAEVIDGDLAEDPLIKKRLETAIKKRYPVTFNENEINTWLNRRLELRQGGVLAQFIEAKYVWVNFKKGEIELIIEREFLGQHTHMTSLFMQVEREKNGFNLNRNASHIGQVKIPGGFARLIIPAFNEMAAELSEEIEIYKDKDGKTKLYDILVEDGKITLDPRLPSQR